MKQMAQERCRRKRCTGKAREKQAMEVYSPLDQGCGKLLGNLVQDKEKRCKRGRTCAEEACNNSKQSAKD